jgi:hypothetical protein
MLKGVLRSGATYAFVIAIATIVGAPLWHLSDWYVFHYFTRIAPLAPDQGVLLLNPESYQLDDVSPLRATLAHFFNRLSLLPASQLPDKIILDFSFDIKDASAHASNDFEASLRRLPKSIALFGVQNPPLDQIFGQDVTGKGDVHSFDAFVHSIDPLIYRWFTAGSGHTTFDSVVGPNIVSYESCLTFPTSDGSRQIRALPVIVAQASDLSVASCNPPTRFFLPLGPNPSFPAHPLKLNGSVDYSLLPGATVVIGSTSSDTKGQVDGVSNPEILAWAIGTGSRPMTVTPLQTPLAAAVMGVDLVNAMIFLALITLLSQVRLKNRLIEPWIAAFGASTITLSCGIALELFFVSRGTINPQVTLPAFSIVATSLIAAVWLRGARRRITPPLPPTYDWDVFISYARDDRRWVEQNVLAVLKGKALEGGQPLKIFLDTKSIEISDVWMDKIALSIIGSRSFVAVYSEKYFESDFCKYELRVAYSRLVGSHNADQTIFPLLHGNPTVPVQYRDIQMADLADDPAAVEKIATRIVDLSQKAVTLRRHLTLAAPPS